MLQSGVIGLTILIVSFYIKFIITNLKKIIDYFVFIFIFLILLYNFKNSGILFDLLYQCKLGFFYYTSYLFVETSHFAIISVPVLMSFVYNINFYIKKKITFLLYIVFIIFAFGNFSLSFYLTIVSSILIILLCCKNLSKLSKFLFIMLLVISNIFFFHQDKISPLTHEQKINKTANCSIAATTKTKNNKKVWVTGVVVGGSIKLRSFFKKQNNNLSTNVYIYSLYVAKSSLLEYPLGVGLKNYVHFRNYFDQTLEVDFKTLEIKFKEGYMPVLPSVILDFNLHTGSTNLSKLLVEFGLVALIILLLIFIYCFSNKIDDMVKVVLITLIFSQLFIRGTGLFNSGFLISLIIIITLIINIISKNKYGKKLFF